MDDVSLPSEIPSELKAIDLLLKRAKELKSHDPVMAYWCCFWAVEVGVADKRTKAGTAVLMDLLDALEKMKVILADNDAVTNKFAGQAYVENFALKVFAGADDEDRAGKASPATVRKFLAAATFLEVTRSFADDGEYDAEMEAKLKYSRFKAASLSKAFKAGTVPQAGPPPSASASTPEPSFPSPPLDKTEAEEEQDRHRETWSNAATPGAVEDDREKQLGLGAKKSSSLANEEDDVENEVLFPSTPGRVRFAGVGDDDEGIQEGLPSFPVPPVEEEGGLDNDAAPSAPPAPLSPPPTTQPLSPVTPEKPPHIQISPLPPSDLAAPPQPPSFPTSPPPAPSPPVVRAPVVKAPAPKPPVVRAAAPAPPPPPPAPSASSWTPVKRDEPLTQAEIEKVQKHAKWAISALNYEDVETAKKELIEALKLLG